MARKLDKSAPAAAEPVSAADAIEALRPGAEITIAGRELVIREYTYFEGLEVAHRAARFISDMHAMASHGELRFAEVRRLFGVHKDVVLAIAAQAADVDVQWLAGLKPEPAEAFMSTWFAVNIGFFVREVVAEAQEAARLRSMASRSTASSSDSPAPGSAISSSSETVSQSGS